MKNKRTINLMMKRAPPLLCEYINYLNTDIGLTSGSIHNYKGPLIYFFRKNRWLKTGADANKINIKLIQKYIAAAGKNLSDSLRRAMSVALRSFFRFVYFKSYHKTDLSFAVPTLITHKQNWLPRPLPMSVFTQLLDNPDRRRAIGRRDYAMLLLFVKYGVRSKQVTNLLIRDIDWRKKVISFKAMKGGKPVVVPIDIEVAKSLLNYLKRDRKDTTYPNVFVGYRRGARGGEPLVKTWSIVSRHLIGAGLPAIHRYRGSHAIRHTIATELLRANQPLKIISDLLGHRSMDTTKRYVQIDLDSMRTLAKPWPSKVRTV